MSRQMVGPNKILTVSYGTFSCTLEGFDDPFAAMKEIAEYFRDLAAEDRFFGAEPPTPDVQALHAIAQKTTRSPVDASLTDQGLHLSQIPTEQDADEAAISTGQNMDGDTREHETDAAVSETPVAEHAAPINPREEATAPSIAELIVATETPHSEPPVFVEEDMPDLADPNLVHLQTERDLDEGRLVTPTATNPAELGDDVADYEAEISDLFQMASTDLPASDLPPAAVSTSPETGLSPSSIAAKLQRIRSVVAASAAPADSPGIPGFDDAETDDLTDVPAFSETQDAPDAEAATETVAEQTTEESDGAEDATAELSEGSVITADQEDTDAPKGLEEAATPGDSLIANALNALTKSDEAPSETPPPESDGGAAEPETPEDEDLSQSLRALCASANEETPKDAQTQPSAAESSEPGPAPLVLDQTELDAAAALVRDRDTPRPAAFRQDLPEDDDAAMTELLQDTLVLSPEATEDAPEPEPSWADAIGDPDKDGTVERLDALADDQLKDAETQRRQSALSHLKAAVAATFAERLGRPGKDQERKEDDLDIAESAPPEPDQSGAPSQSDETEKTEEDETAAPFVLVPQARIDETAVSGSVRPRRVTRSSITEQDSTRAQDSGFADYAGSLGATELGDLLEAAAAYLSEVEGKSHFSRPEVMHMVMRHDRDRSFSREESLRSFGDLLRNGTIEKIDRGQFVISTESRYVANG